MTKIPLGRFAVLGAICAIALVLSAIPVSVKINFGKAVSDQHAAVFSLHRQTASAAEIIVAAPKLSKADRAQEIVAVRFDNLTRIIHGALL